MCGICAYLSNESWRRPADLAWLDRVAGELDGAGSGMEVDWGSAGRGLEGLAEGFDALMSFGLHVRIAAEPEVRERVERVRGRLEALRREAAGRLQEAHDEALERLHERLADYLWQVDHEVLGFVQRCRDLMPAALRGEGTPGRELQRAPFFLAWSLEQVLESLEKLEVRGRDSAGLVVACVLEEGADPLAALDAAGRDELARRRVGGAGGAEGGGEGGGEDELAESGQVLVRTPAEGAPVVRFLYKVANPVGRLGDNAADLRRQIRGDALLWRMTGALAATNVLSHTRWASNGIINVPNGHPLDGRALHGLEGPPGPDADAMFVLNGDVDNYRTLVESAVASRGARIDPAVSTDAKILPVLYRLATDAAEPPRQRFRTVMQRGEGSLAVVLQHPDRPRALFLGQKGSGQSLYAGHTRDGWVVASELYGLAARCRTSRPLAGTERGGMGLTLTAGAAPQDDGAAGLYLGDGEAVLPGEEPIAIFSRDVYRGDFDHYIDKEIHDAPDSVRKTLLGKYRRHDEERRVEFLVSAFGNGPALVERLEGGGRPPVRRILAVGQGTAAIAAMGVAHLLRRAVAGTGVTVEAAKASELFGFLSDDRPLTDVLLIAVSQSGTTTDTNRVADLARDRGAWVHAIVNRRDSPLVRKADSHLYTSNGRDVEMSVASTKAYYSQVAAGKLLALLLADRWHSMGASGIYDDLVALEKLPGKIEEVLAGRGEVAAVAAEYGPAHRYWALVGNGANRIAAEEIRIKLSELCYKAIPCDITEDKKHIDLSTEPLTLVVANDLPEAVVQDTVKEVAIFQAHNGRPLVICARDETRFDGFAERLLRVPRLGGGLDFVLATVVGHLWGIEAAKAIDRQAARFRHVRTLLADVLEAGPDWDRRPLQEALSEVLELAADGRTDSALPTGLGVSLARYAAWLAAQPPELTPAAARLDEALALVHRIVEEMSRPIDTIRHQAKTVTVGISRPRREMSEPVLEALTALGVSPSALKEKDRHLLEALSPLVTGVDGGLLYAVEDAAEYDPGAPPPIRAVAAVGEARLEDSRYAAPRPAAGTKRKVLRLGSACWTAGPEGRETVLLLPIYGDGGWTCGHEALLHLDLVPAASEEQKLDLLRQLGSKLEELSEQVEEVHAAAGVHEVVRRASPRELVFDSVQRLVREHGED